VLVISRNAVFVHKGKAVKAKEIAREFGVDYVVEGSVRKTADRVRVTVQLVDGETETHVWAERYDRKLEDIFDIQDEVTAAIVATCLAVWRLQGTTGCNESAPKIWRHTNMC
jgi:adenylate cyclase